jgi:Icc-related predicted phosphoesterase
MKILHFSDNHGQFDDISNKEFDVVVCSGDFFPNKNWGPLQNSRMHQEEIKFQTGWLKDRIPFMKEWLQNKPFLFCSGNHDFINPCAILQENGIKAIDLDNNVVEYGGLTWYGFPYIPMIQGFWNKECGSQYLKEETDKFVKRLEDANKFDALDVLVSHCPLYGILDECFGEHCGNQHMNNVLAYRFNKLPKLMCFGHIHNSWGCDTFGEEDEMFISNAATGYRILEI